MFSINQKYKYPRTYHFSWSEGLQNDDKCIESLDNFVGKDVVVTVKLDGENTTMYPDHIHARSIDSVDHPSRHWVKGLHGGIKYLIPDGWRICGENMYAQHSITYDDLDTYFYVFNIWDEQNDCLSWDSTLDMCDALDLTPVPVLYQGIWDEDKFKEIAANLDTDKVEGFVVRLREKFSYADFSKSVVKWVRKGHVQDDEGHWMTKQVIKNKLKQNEET